MANVTDSYNSTASSTSASGFDIFTTLASQSSQQTALATSALSSGLGFYQKKDYAKAANEIKRAISLDPSSTQALNYLGNIYVQQKKTGDAIKIYQASLAMDPTQDSVHSSLANIYLGKKQYNDAEKEFKAAIKLNPGDTVAPYMLGQMYQQNGRYAEAEKQFKQVIRMAPGDANPLYALGATYNKEGKHAEAVKVLTQAVKLKPKMAAAHLELGSAYGALGDTNNAQLEVDKLTAIDATQGALLQAVIAKPKIVAAGGGLTDSFVSALGVNTPLWSLDSSLMQPSTSKEFSLTFSFDSKMDPLSVQDTSNWTITKATGGAAGYYNNLLPVLPTEAYIPQNPTSVRYDPTEQQATVTFLLSQNANGDATIDPSHMVFKFSGTGSTGKAMDPTADQYDGYGQQPI
ncbi:MAG TPA: tetratricopeptide repeat protein [Geomonas sp.]